MSNLQQAKEAIQQSKTTTSKVINPPNQKKAKLPLLRDINLIEQTLREEISKKQKEIENKMIKETTKKWEPQISQLHTKAVNLHQEVESLAQAIKANSQGAITIDTNSYGHDYWSNLPEQISDLDTEKMIEIIESDDLPEIKKIREKADRYMLSLKIGLAPISDVQPLLDEINKIK
jgi:capsule polysaccharide export protein KpsE/RkpR